MKKKIIVAALFLALVNGCSKPQWEEEMIDLGNVSTSTNIKSITQNKNVIIAQFETTIGSKYSVQIIPFGSDVPVRNEGFTATNDLTIKEYDLSNLAKKDYDLIFIDINGKEVKYPIVIK